MSTTPPPYDPSNRNDPRYDPRLDPRAAAANGPRWQAEQAKAWQRNAKAQADAARQQQKYAAQQQRDYFRARAKQQKDMLRAARRSSRAPSIVGPLCLIAVAVVVLLVHNGRISLQGLFTWYSRWWPVLLIGFGLLRLGEWAVDRAFHRPGQPAVRYTMGGGVITVIVLLVLTGIATQGGVHYDGNQWNLGFTDGDTWKQFLGSKHEQDTPSASRAIASTGALVIDNPRGDVTVSGTSDDGLLHLSTHKEVFTSSDSDAQNRLLALEPQFSGTDDNLVLRINGHDNDDTDLTVLVPAGVRVSINANRGDVKATNFRAATSVTANRGDVDVAAISGPLSVRVNSRNKSVLAHSIDGPVTVQGTGDEINLTDIHGPVGVNGDFLGGGHLQHITGPVDYSTSRITFHVVSLEGDVNFDDHDEFSAKDCTGPFTLRTRSRDLTLARISGDINVTNSHGKVELSAIPPGGAITVDNHDGDIRLDLPQQAKFTLAAETSDGDVSSNFSVFGSNGAHGTLNGTVSGGGNAVRLTTTHGDIAIDHSGAATPATPATPKTPNIPMKLGFGSVPAPPPPPGALPGLSKQDLADIQKQTQDAMKLGQKGIAEALRSANGANKEALQQAAEAIREAQQQAAEARRDAEQAKREAALQTAEAQREAGQARKEAERNAADAKREAAQQAEQAKREAALQAAEAQREAGQAKREAAQQAAQAKRELAQQVAEAKREAAQQAAEARREAKQQADEARRQAQHPND